MKKRTLSPVVGLAVLLPFLSGCFFEEPISSEEIPASTLTKLEALGFNTQNARMFSEQDPIVGKRSGYLLEGDLKITDAYLESTADPISGFSIQEEQYYQGNLILGLPRTLEVVGYTGGTYALDSRMQTALSWAVANYNVENLLIDFNLTFSTSTSGADIVVYKTGSGVGGSSGYPSGGNPYPYIQVFGGNSAYSTNVVEWVMTHQLGHVIGMAHTDAKDPLACGYNPSASAIHIPGTPTAEDPTSAWQTCFPSSSTGELNANDKVALDYLY